MEFKKLVIINDNGDVKGYRQEGVYKDGKIEFTRNQKITSPKKNKSISRVFIPSEETRKEIESVKQKDAAFIKECEQKLRAEEKTNKYVDLRNKLRKILESNVDSDILYDFKNVVRIMDTEKPNRRNINVLNKLLEKYNVQ